MMYNNYYNYLAQVVPTSYSFPVTDVVSVNGSSVTGQCSSFTNSSGTFNCADPTSSVLFDGHIPILTGLDGDMWASQLLTMMPTAATTDITFDFHNTPDTTVRVEVVMFNCPQWGIGVDNIVIRENMVGIGSINRQAITSCGYLVRTCAVALFSSTTASLRFVLSSTSIWVHLAEVTFHTDTSGCPPDTIVTGATLQTSITPSLRETTTAMETHQLQTITPQAETTSSSECAPSSNGTISSDVGCKNRASLAIVF